MKSNFSAIRSQATLSKEIEQHIENLIRKKKIVPGEKLPTELELCDLLSVSRTSLREALQMLSARGLITIKKGSGIYVSDFTSEKAIDSLSLFLELNINKEYILHFIHVRQIIEPFIASLAAANRTEEDLTELRATIAELKECCSTEFDRQGELDRKFHLIIAEASKNPVLPIIMDPIFRQMPRMRAIVYEMVDVARSSAIQYHKNIYQAIRDEDCERAFKMMKKHLEFAAAHSKAINE